MSDHAQVKALADELAQCPKYSLAISDMRMDLSRQILTADAAMVRAVSATMGANTNTPAHSKG